MLKRKFLLIISILGEIEDECEFSLLLHEHCQLKQIDPDIAENPQIFFEIVKYIVKVAEVPENTYVVRAYLTSDNHAQRVEFYSTPLSMSSKNLEIEVRWLDLTKKVL